MVFGMYNLWNGDAKTTLQSLESTCSCTQNKGGKIRQDPSSLLWWTLDFNSNDAIILLEKARFYRLADETTEDLAVVKQEITITALSRW